MSPFEEKMVELGVSWASAFSLPRSVGSIFGLLFASPQPLGLDDLTEKLGISKGSVSMGLNFLHRMGAIHTVKTPGSRRTTYEPELSIRRLLDGVLQATVLPHLKDSTESLDDLEASLDLADPEERAILERRLKALRTWRRKAQTLAPLIAKLLGAAKR
ncbi:GbsR/MarR family transcriptional regulator [Puniceicoccus vermicola]|uniref:HTH-type transcriptional regulator n=1 Tax=Puniceicoccus vermicola TaxID=388746 RepID=A0A7X1AYH6_9BACT|nr:transcriptional regulator [Puniceicoccus vermicola]MBC2601243.1 transcriptional regulator [Puniceicoccus vermicola]